jgi:hypothetical protein
MAKPYVPGHHLNDFQLYKFANNDAEPQEQAAMKDHLSRCPYCAKNMSDELRADVPPAPPMDKLRAGLK